MKFIFLKRFSYYEKDSQNDFKTSLRKECGDELRTECANICMSHIPSVNNPHVPVLTGDKKNMDFWYFTPRYLTKVEINFRKSNNGCKFFTASIDIAHDSFITVIDFRTI